MLKVTLSVKNLHFVNSVALQLTSSLSTADPDIAYVNLPDIMLLAIALEILLFKTMYENALKTLLLKCYVRESIGS